MEEPETKPEVVEPVRQLWWLASVTVVYRLTGLEKFRPVNVLFTTQTNYIGQQIIGNINVAAQKQVMEQKKIPEKATIVDVVINGFSMLGLMSEAEFRAKAPNV